MHVDSVCASDFVKGKPNAADNVSMMRLLITKPPNASEDWLENLQRDIKRVKWADDFTMELSTRTVRMDDKSPPQELGIQRAEVVTCLSSMLHALLNQQDVYAFSKTNINNVVKNPRYLRLATKVADVFTARFDPVSFFTSQFMSLMFRSSLSYHLSLSLSRIVYHFTKMHAYTGTKLV
jgi:hypothetical protein